jgi:uncharacterized protein YdhG (YjbR/CyaY superfamily)
MPNPTQEVDEYLSKLDPQRRMALTQLRSLSLETLPAAVATMRYKMPTYDYEGAMLCAFASQKQYMIRYVGPKIFQGHCKQLQHLNLGKSCISFKSFEQFPLEATRTTFIESAQAQGTRRDQSDKRRTCYSSSP